MCLHLVIYDGAGHQQSLSLITFERQSDANSTRFRVGERKQRRRIHSLDRLQGGMEAFVETGRLPNSSVKIGLGGGHLGMRRRLLTKGCVFKRTNKDIRQISKGILS